MEDYRSGYGPLASVLAGRPRDRTSVQVARLPGLDGLRGVAILLVVFAHTMEGVYPSHRGLHPIGSYGGFVGVQLFFVLSGFLITRLLLSEREGTGSVDLLAFYRRRISRLYPSLLVVAAFVALLDPWSAVRAVTYTSNIPAGPRGLGWLGHSWSLSVEEQFYLAWPALLVLARGRAARVTGAGILAAVALQWLLPWEVAYHAVRWDALLAGCLLALRPVRGSGGVALAGWVVLLAYTAGFHFGSAADFTAATLACAAVVTTYDRAPWLGAGWLRHVGHISYAWYLWHVLVMRLDYPAVYTLAASLVLAELTYWLVDKQAQRRRHEVAGNRVRGGVDADSLRLHRVHRVG